MNNVPSIFKFNFNQVRVIEKDGEPWFVAKDVADMLGYENTREAIANHCKRSCILVLPSGKEIQETIMIPKLDVYQLIVSSKASNADNIAEWIVDTVLPTFQKIGSQPECNTLDEMLLMLVQQKVVLDCNLKELEAKIASAIDNQYYVIEDYSNLIGIGLTQEAITDLSEEAFNLSKEKGYEVGEVYHPRYDLVCSFHEDIIEQVFSKVHDAIAELYPSLCE